MKKDTVIFVWLVIIVLLLIGGIYLFKYLNKETPEEQTMKCIAKEATLYSQTTCIHCKQQKEILGEYLSLFKIIECDQTPLLCPIEVKGTPTWEFNGKFYPNVRSIKELADIVGCECNANIQVVKDDSAKCDVENQTNDCTIEAQTICSE